MNFNKKNQKKIKNNKLNGLSISKSKLFQKYILIFLFEILANKKCIYIYIYISAF